MRTGEQVDKDWKSLNTTTNNPNRDADISDFCNSLSTEEWVAWENYVYPGVRQYVKEIRKFHTKHEGK